MGCYHQPAIDHGVGVRTDRDPDRRRREPGELKRQGDGACRERTDDVATLAVRDRRRKDLSVRCRGGDRHARQYPIRFIGDDAAHAPVGCVTGRSRGP